MGLGPGSPTKSAGIVQCLQSRVLGSFLPHPVTALAVSKSHSVATYQEEALGTCSRGKVMGKLSGSLK